MSNKKRILITSFSVIILCLCILVGVSYSLFTDSEQVTNHLKSGELDITLERTNLEYVTLNEQGYLEVKENTSFEIKSMPFVSRGGFKLDKAIKYFNIDLKDKVCLDAGASTGGFTDCMLQNGAKKVYSVDVGY